MSLFKKILGDPNSRILKSMKSTVDAIGGFEAQIQKLDDVSLKSKTSEFKDRLARGETLEDLLPEAYAVVRETARRKLGQRHFDVQLLGGAVLHKGQIAEMRTGEGKTLTATAPLYLNALSGKGAHLVTVNDYLAKFQCQWMGAVYTALDLTVGCIQHESAFRYDSASGELVSVTRREAYECDITYGTNNEFGFDYLRDNMVASLKERAQRGLHYAIVDEVDSILIDEARTPLIISAPAEDSNDRYYRFAELIRKLEPEVDDNIDEKMKAATLTEAGIAKLEKLLNVDNLYTSEGIRTIHHIEQALRAERLFKKDRDYVVKDGEVVIVDEFTGRLMQGRRYSEGLHQAIEAKEGVKIQRESQTLATITFQNYFRLYEKLAGMTGTAETEAEEFHKIYNLEVVVIPTHKPMIRKDLSDRIYKNEKGKFKAVVREIKERHALGQPVLVGTISIQKNERLAEILNEEGVPYEVLNAKNHEREASIIAEAGRVGAVTLATNMAGRGVDIILGGSPPERVNGQVVDKEAEARWSVEHEKVIKLGGLHVIGTERHESRRIDNQLRGRAGRQGDAGSSQFYVSTEDDLMRIFSSERVGNMMDRLGVPDDMPIENKIVSRSLESAQRRVEGHNFDIRKRLVDYDDVINKHRDTVYRQRTKILKKFEESLETGTDLLKPEVINMVEQEIESIVAFHTGGVKEGDVDIKEVSEVLRTIYPVSLNIEEKIKEFSTIDEKAEVNAERRTGLIEAIVSDAEQAYEEVRRKVEAVIDDEHGFLSVERSLILRAIDTIWIEHLETMDHLRQGIGLRGYGQRDPLVEYKREAYRLFLELLSLIRKQVVYSIYKISVATDTAPALMNRNNIILSGAAKTMSERQTQNNVAPGEKANISSKTVRKDKVGRNEPCPCGSGLKYKKCGLIDAPRHNSKTGGS